MERLVAPGVGDGSVAPLSASLSWLRMPLSGPLSFINLWVIDDGDAWTLIDCGLSDRDTRSAWQAALANPLADKPVGRILVTHGHADHLGAAGWLARETGAPLFIARGEFAALQNALAGDDLPARTFYTAAGLDANAIDAWVTRIRDQLDYYRPLPDAGAPLQADETIRIGGREWRMIGCSGHSPEHIGFWSPDDRILVAGDQVLPRFTANISAWPGPPDYNPLAHWLDGLGALESTVPDDVLILPSHGDPFRGLHARIAEMRAGHHAMLARIATALDRPRRIVDLLDAAFGKKIGPHRIGGAIGEVAACLQWLEAQGRAMRDGDEGGVHWWRLSGP